MQTMIRREAPIQSHAFRLQREALRNGRRLTWCVALSLARAAYAPAILIRNSGPGGPDCRAKSEKTCRCSTHDLLPAGSEGRKLAEAALKKIVGKNIENAELKISGEVSGDSVGKIVSGNALGTTFRGLVDTGNCDKNTAYQIHMTAAANIDELFSNATRKEEQNVYHGGEYREAAIHLYSPFKYRDNQGNERELEADISILKYKSESRNIIYSLGMTIGLPK